MKNQQEIEHMLRTEIDNHRLLNSSFADAIKRGDNIKDIQNIFFDCNKSTNRIILLKEILNQD